LSVILVTVSLSKFATQILFTVEKNAYGAVSVVSLSILDFFLAPARNSDRVPTSVNRRLAGTTRPRLRVIKVGSAGSREVSRLEN
jgi:hypothetical protein